MDLCCLSPHAPCGKSPPAFVRIGIGAAPRRAGFDNGLFTDDLTRRDVAGRGGTWRQPQTSQGGAPEVTGWGPQDS